MTHDVTDSETIAEDDGERAEDTSETIAEDDGERAEDAGENSENPEPADETHRKGPLRWLLSANIKRWASVALIIVMLAVGAAGWWRVWDLRSGDAAENLAVVDATADGKVRTAVSQALTQVFSYDYQQPEVTEEAASRYLSGDARKEYDTLFEVLKKKAPNQKLTLTAQVQTIAVKELSNGKASLLVFLDQRSQRAKDHEASASAAQLAVTAEEDGGKWTITQLKPL